MDIPLASWDQCLRVYGTSGALDSQKSIGVLKASVEDRYFKAFFAEGQWMCAGGEGRDVCQVTVYSFHSERF